MLDHPEEQRGLKLLSRSDEIWAKLDGGTQFYLNLVDHLDVSSETILENILLVARQRPVMIQSLLVTTKPMSLERTTDC